MCLLYLLRLIQFANLLFIIHVSSLNISGRTNQFLQFESVTILERLGPFFWPELWGSMPSIACIASRPALFLYLPPFSFFSMDPNQSEVVFEFPPFLRVYKDGHAERIQHSEFIPPSMDPSTGVLSKDVIIQSETGLSVRIYLPKVTDPQQKLPLLIYFHGGGFCIESSSSPFYHRYLNSLVPEANVVAMSVDYRKAPEHPLPIAYEDSWTSLQWVISQSKENEWFQKHVDYERVFMAGDSAGANIAHNMAIRVGVLGLDGMKIDGIVLIHPYFMGNGIEGGCPSTGMGEKLWDAVCPGSAGWDDPLANPDKDPNLSKLGCRRVLVCVAEKDGLRDRGWFYCEKLGKCGWNGSAEFMETKEENHVFHLFNPTCEKAVDMRKRVVSFINTSI